MTDITAVQFYVDDVNVTPSTGMNMAQIGSTLLRPIVEVQSSSGQVHQADIDYISVLWER